MIEKRLFGKEKKFSGFPVGTLAWVPAVDAVPLILPNTSSAEHILVSGPNSLSIVGPFAVALATNLS
jgi:hypothetical protein